MTSVSVALCLAAEISLRPGHGDHGARSKVQSESAKTVRHVFRRVVVSVHGCRRASPIEKVARGTLSAKGGGLWTNSATHAAWAFVRVGPLECAWARGQFAGDVTVRSGRPRLGQGNVTASVFDVIGVMQTKRGFKMAPDGSYGRPT